MEIARGRAEGAELSAEGTQIGVRPQPYELRYVLERNRSLRLELVGARLLEIELPEWADFFDLGFSPLFNTMPLLSTLDEPKDFVMAWIAVPELEVRRSDQRYAPLRPGIVRYSGSHRPGEPHFDLELDQDGFVTLYPGLAERVE
jgi:hypothetical protein